jgi:hypothetical protein
MRMKPNKFDQNLGIYDEFQPAHPEHPIIYIQKEREQCLLISEYSIRPEELTKSIIESPGVGDRAERATKEGSASKEHKSIKINKDFLTIETPALISKNLSSRFQNFPSSRKVTIPATKTPFVQDIVLSKSPADRQLKRSDSRKKEALLFHNKMNLPCSRQVPKPNVTPFNKQKMWTELPYKSTLKDRPILHAHHHVSSLPLKDANELKHGRISEAFQTKPPKSEHFDELVCVKLTTPKVFTSFNNSSVKGSHNELSYQSRHSSAKGTHHAEPQISFQPITAPSSNFLTVPKTSAKQISLKNIPSKRQTQLHNSLAINKLVYPPQKFLLKNNPVETASKELAAIKKQTPVLIIQESTQRSKVVDSRVALSKRLIYPPLPNSYATIDSVLQKMTEKGVGVQGLLKDKKIIGNHAKDIPQIIPKSKPSLRNIELKNLKSGDKWSSVVSKPLFAKKEYGALEHRPIPESKQKHEFGGRIKPEQASLYGPVECILTNNGKKIKR